MGTKVVVIGAGGAGLTAAIAAAKKGANVTLISKTQVGLATCTAYSAGVFSLAEGTVTPEDHFQKTLKTGQEINNPSLVRILTEEAEKTIRELSDWGVQIKLSGKGRASARATAPNELMGGAGFTAELTGIAKNAGVRFIEWSVATKIITRKNRVCGVHFTNWRNGKTNAIAADAVILATGGGGQLYSRTDNPSRITGDGYALAKDLGLELIDMEFVQFYPIGWADSALPAWMGDAALVDYMRITDADGREFFKEALAKWGYKNGAEANLYARDRCSILMAEADRRGGAFAHLEDVADDMWQDKGLLYALTIDVRYVQNLKRPVRIAPLEHYMCGGVKIDTSCRTGIEGLYACGETTGGVDGANRIGGNALSNIVTFGMIAGKNASEECENNTSIEEHLRSFTQTDSGASPKEIRALLQKKAWEAIGPIRSAKGIEDFLSFLEDIRERELSFPTPNDLLLALEMPGLFATAEAVAKAALARKESLGTHYREDSEAQNEK